MINSEHWKNAGTSEADEREVAVLKVACNKAKDEKSLLSDSLQASVSK